MYTVEQTRELIGQATFIQIDDLWLRINYTSNDSFGAVDEDNDGEEYEFQFTEVDLSKPDVLLYGLKLLNE